LHAWRHVEAARAAHYQQALDAGRLGRICDLCRRGLQEPDGADDDVVAAHGISQCLGVGDIGVAGGDAVTCGSFDAWRAIAVTAWPRRSASSVRRVPTLPVAPMMAIFMVVSSRKWLI
jgi:hypothetical protein